MTGSLHFYFSIFYSACAHLKEWFCIYPVVWKLGKNPENYYTPTFHRMFQDMSELYQSLKLHLICGSHWSADLTQRSTLFICDETNSSWRLASSIAFAVSWINSGQFFSALCIPVKHQFCSSINCRSLPPPNCTWTFGGCWVFMTLCS